MREKPTFYGETRRWRSGRFGFECAIYSAMLLNLLETSMPD